MVLVLCVCCPVFGDWPQFAGPDRSAIVDSRGIARSWPDTGPPVRWSVGLGKGFAGPAVKDGRVYLLDRPDDDRDALRCFDLKSGKQLWRKTYDAPGRLPGYQGSRAVPAVDEKHVYTVGTFGHVRCNDRMTGALVWQMHLFEQFGGELPKWGTSQSPLRYKDWLILAPCGTDAGLIAVAPDTGRLVWKTEPIGQLHHTSPIVFPIAGRDQILFITTEGVFGFDAADGKTLWRYTGFRAKRFIPCPIAVDENRVFITAGYNAGSRMLRIEQQNGRFAVKELWRNEEIGAQIHQPLLYKGHLYAACNTNNRNDGLVCFTLDGQIKWKTGLRPNFERGGLILAGDLLHIVDGRRGTLHLANIDPAGYHEIASCSMLNTRMAWAPPALSDGLLLIRDQDTMKCLDVSARK